MTLPLTEAMIAWQPRTDRVKVGPWPDESGWSDDFLMTGGACYRDVLEMDEATRRRYALNLFHTLVIRDGVDPMAAHKALCRITEFARSINTECPGAIE